MNLKNGKLSKSTLGVFLLNIVIFSFNAGMFISSSTRGSANHDPMRSSTFLVGCVSIFVAVFTAVVILRRAT